MKCIKSGLFITGLVVLSGIVGCSGASSNGGLSDADSVAAAKTSLDITEAAGGNLQAVTLTTITLPDKGAEGTTITWSSDNTAVIANDGTVTRKVDNETVKLTATISKGTATPVTKDFSLTVLSIAVSGLSPADGSRTTDTTPTFSWNAVPGVAEYELQIADSDAGVEGATVQSVTGPSYTPTTALVNKQTHYWRVRAKAGDGQYGAWSEVQSLSVNWGIISGLSPATGGETPDTTPALSWDAVPGAAGYEVQIADSEAGVDSAPVVEVIGTSYTPSTALANKQTHYWRVRAKGGDGQYGAWSEVQSLSVNLGTVSGLSPADGSRTTDTTPTFSWNAVPGVAEYELQIASSEADVEEATAQSVTGISYTPTMALTDQQTYYWRVRAKDGAGQYGAWSAATSIQIGYVVGDDGPAGGIVFYDKGSYSDDWRYLEAAKSDQATSVEWGGYRTSVGVTSTDIGDGKANTEAIVQALGNGNYSIDSVVELNGNYAAKICDVLVLGGHDDWFLPSKGELNELYKQRNIVGGFASSYYWSSSEYSSGIAWAQIFGNGDQSTNFKLDDLHVRAVRAF